jgi:hypothetical protein
MDFRTSKTLTIGLGYSGNITWQHSIDNINWTTINGADSASYIVDEASIGANYYRAKFSVAPCTPDAYSAAVVLYYKSCGARIGDSGIDDGTEVSTNSGFSVIAYPNPSSNVFTLEVQSSAKGATTGVQVYDMTGRLIEQRQVNSNTVEVGSNYPSGTYNVIVTQNANSKTVRVIRK